MATEPRRRGGRSYDMRQRKVHFFAAVALIMGIWPAHAFTRPDFNAPPTIAHVRESQLASSRPAGMSYTDQMAQSLGVRNGSWEAFQSTDPMMPSVKAGLDGGAPMLKLQWRP
jgi:hypothetical protein